MRRTARRHGLDGNPQHFCIKSCAEARGTRRWRTCCIRVYALQQIKQEMDWRKLANHYGGRYKVGKVAFREHQFLHPKAQCLLPRRRIFCGEWISYNEYRHSLMPFQFDSLIFKFPKLYLQDSPIFQQLFSNVEDTEFTGKGTSLKPYSCRGVKQETFASLLRVSRTTT